MRIIFAGTPSNAASSLKTLVGAAFDVVGVLTRTDSQQGRSKTLTPTKVAEAASELGLETYKTNRIDDQAKAWIRAKAPDLGVVVAYGSIFRDEELVIPVHGWINLHYSLLPDFPGPAPVQHAILSGREETGVTIFSLDEGVDTGDIIASKKLKILPNETAGELLKRLTDVGNQLLIDTLLQLPQSLSNAKAQPKGFAHSIAFKPTRDTARLDLSKTSAELELLVRAMNPEPMAWLEHGGNPVRILKVEIAESEELGVGQLVIRDHKVLLGCGSGTVLELREVQPSGKKPMDASAWYRGLREFVVS